MSDTPAPRKREPFSSLWPWPGNLFLLLLAVWLFYMGKIAHLADVKTAFYGLGGVTMLTLFLGLRTVIGRRGDRADRLERGAPQQTASERRRSAIPAAEPAMLISPPGRSNDRGNVRAMYPAMSEPQRRDDTGEAILELEAALNRDRAERGAQIVKLEHAMAALAARLDRSTAGGDTDTAERMRALETRLAGERPERAELAQLVARLGALEKRAAAEPDLAGYLKVQTFNNAVSERLVPRMQQMIANALRDRSGPSAAGSGAAGEALAAQIADVRAAMAAAHDAAREERATMQLELRALRGGGGGGEQGAGADLSALRSEVAELKAALAARGGEEHIGGGIKRRVAAAEAALGEMRDGLAALGQSLARAEAGWREMLPRLDALAADSDGEPTSPADVATLRDALTSVIEQKREGRTRQERLSARFDPATRVGLDPTDRT